MVFERPRTIADSATHRFAGFLTMTVPIYQAEISHRKIRGRITNLQQLFIALGAVFATWIGYGSYLSYRNTGNSAEWRIPLACQIVPALILGSLIFRFPESPRYDAMRAAFNTITLT